MRHLATASLFWLVLTVPHGGAAQAPVGSDVAAAHFHKGEAAYAAKDYEGAIAEFSQSLEASGSPNAHLAIARCLRELGRTPEAVSAYEQTVAEAGIRAESDEFYSQTLKVAKQELARIAGFVGRVRVETVPADAELRVNGRTQSTSERTRSVPVAPGTVVLEVSAPGHEPVQREVVVRPGQQLVERVVLKDSGEHAAETVTVTKSAPKVASSASDSLLVPIGWTAVIGGAVGVGTFTLFYLLAGAQHDKLERTCVNTPCSMKSYNDISDTGKTEQTVAHVALGVGIAALAVGASLLLWDALSTPAADVEVSRDGAVLSVRGTF